jgi:hypothetical protein
MVLRVLDNFNLTCKALMYKPLLKFLAFQTVQFDYMVFFINKHVHSNYKPRAWMACVAFDLSNWLLWPIWLLSNETTNQIGQWKYQYNQCGQWLSQKGYPLFILVSILGQNVH